MVRHQGSFPNACEWTRDSWCLSGLWELLGVALIAYPSCFQGPPLDHQETALAFCSLLIRSSPWRRNELSACGTSHWSMVLSVDSVVAIQK